MSFPQFSIGLFGVFLNSFACTLWNLSYVLKYFYLFIICLLMLFIDLFIYWHIESVKFYAVNLFILSFCHPKICF